MSIADEIDRLEQQRSQGSLTDAEFAEAKRQLLDGQPQDVQHFGEPQLFGMDEKLWCTLMHLSQLIYWTGAGLLVPIVMWYLSKDESELARRHGTRMMNWLISEVIYVGAAIVLTVVLIGIPLLLVLGVLGIVFPVMAAIKCQNDEVWSYPLTIRFFSED